MHKLTLILVTLAVLGVHADISHLLREPQQPQQAQRRFRPLPARFTKGLGQRQEALEPEQPSGYNYPKPEAPVQVETVEYREPEKKPEPTRVVFVGVPQRQLQFEELVYYPGAFSFEYYPYTSVDVVPVREVAYSTEIVREVV